MVYAALAKLKKNSVSTTLSAGINDSITTIPVADTAVFHDADSVLIKKGIVIGYDDSVESASEEITITAATTVSGPGNLTGVTRGVKADGTDGIAKAWSSGTNIAVMFSTGIYDQICDNIAAHESGKEPTLTKGNLTASTPVALDNTRQVIGGAAVVSLVNDAAAAVTEIDTGALAASDTKIPTSLAVQTYVNTVGQAWAAWTPTLAWGTATPTGITTKARWTQIGRIVFYSTSIYATDSNGCTSLTITSPKAGVATGMYPPADGQEQYGVGLATRHDPLAYYDPSLDKIYFNDFAAGTDEQPIYIAVSGSYEVS